LGFSLEWGIKTDLFLPLAGYSLCF